MLLSKNVFAEIVDVTSDKYILYNMNETEVLSEKNSHEKAYVASLTKLMTVLVAVENIDDYFFEYKEFLLNSTWNYNERRLF